MGVPIGIQDFKKIRDTGSYIVDKTALIDLVLSDASTRVFLFTRPRRFGKSTNLNMLDAYLNLNYRGNGWFDGLNISTLRPDDPDKNSNPVIYLDLKDLGNGDFDRFLTLLKMKISDIFESHLYLRDSYALYPEALSRFDSYYRRTCDEDELILSLRDLTKMLHVYHGRRPVILVDEYDDILNRSYGKPDQRRILDFLRDMMSCVLKGNENLRFGVITGIMQIAKESIFSGLNSLYVDNILSTRANEMFGFNSEEVRKLCEDFGHPEKFDEAKEWYDGYRFGDADIYNPWSVLSYVKAGFVPGKYWAGTSGNGIIEDLVSRQDDITFRNLMALGSGGTISTNLRPGVTFADISDRGSGIYSVLVQRF